MIFRSSGLLDCFGLVLGCFGFAPVFLCLVALRFWLVVLVLSSCVLASWFSLVWFAAAVMFGLVIVMWIGLVI